MTSLKEEARGKFTGIWAALTTPFTESFELDEEGLQRNVRYAAEELNVEGVFVNGYIGEFWALTVEERKRALEVIVDAARGRCFVNAHIGHHSADETIGLIRHARDVGADFCIAPTTYYPTRRNQEGIYEWWKYVSTRTEGIGLWIFDTPATAQWNPEVRMLPETAARIAEFDNIVGMKQGWPLDMHDPYYKALNDTIIVSQPDEVDWLTLMRDYGQPSHMASPSVFLYQRPGWMPVEEYTKLARAGDFAAAQEIAHGPELTGVRTLFAQEARSRAESENTMTIAWIKAWSELLGMAGGPVRPPLRTLTSEERKVLEEKLQATPLLGNL